MLDLIDSSRRHFLRNAGLNLLALPLGEALLTLPLSAAEVVKATSPASLPPLNRFPRMVQEWLVEKLRAAERQGTKVRAELKTKEDALAYVKAAQSRIRECFGPEPEKTPLNAKVTGVVERDAYRLEKIIFESRPGFLVTGNLYVPKGRSGKMPGVVGSCGHSLNGKAAEAYQSFAQGLARMGYVVFIFDPVGQGERFQYVGEDLKSRYSGGVGEHLQMGNQQSLLGEFLGAWRAWDGIRALDYLLTRPEVDPNHVGITGNSGGGTLTTWLCGVERRWTMAAPACFVTTFRRNAENELPADTEQCPPAAIALGLDHADFLAAMAPKPIIILSQEKDFFDTRGSKEAYDRLKQLYTLLGAPENIQLHVGADYHGYTQGNREAMYRFFNGVTGISDAKTEPPLTIEKDETLWCTPHGQVSELGSRPLFTFTREAAQALAKSRGKLSGDSLKQAVRETLKLPNTDGVPDYRILRSLSARKYPTKTFCQYAVETEAGILPVVTLLSDETLLSRPPRGRRRALLYVSHHSADAELRDEPLVAEVFKSEAGSAFYACDVRGIGESQPDTCGANQFLKPYGNDFFYSMHGLMLNRPYVGQRTFDVLRLIDWLVGNGHEEVHLVGVGWGALPVALAALLSDRVKQVTLKHAPGSYTEIAETEDYVWPCSALLHGALRKFDLPEVYAALSAKGLRNLEPWGAKNGMD